MAGSRKEYEMLFKLQASLGSGYTSAFKNATTAIKGLDTNIKQLQSTQKNISSYQKQSSALEANKKKLQDLKSEHDKLQKELKETENPTEALKNKFAKSESQIAKTTAKIKEQETSLENLSRELKQAGVNTSNLTGESEKLSKQYTKLSTAQKNIAELSKVAEANKQAIGQTQTQILTTAGAAAAGAAVLYKGTITKAAEFQQSIKKTAAISQATEEEFKMLSDAAKIAGRDTSFNAVEASEALGYMSLAGWKAATSTKALMPVLKTAAATEMDLATCSDLVTDSMGALGIGVEDLEHYLNLCVQANNSANTTAGDLMEAFIGCGGAAKTVGASLDDMSVALGILANNGTKGTEAGTALNSMLVRMTSKDVAIKAMQDLGVSVFDNTGKFRGFSQVLKDLSGAMSGLTTEQKASYMASIAGTNYYTEMAYLMDAMNVNAETGKVAWNELAQAMSAADAQGGAVAKMYATMTSTYEGKVDEFQSAIESLQISVGDALLPAVTSLVVGITPLIQQFSNFCAENPELIQQIVKMAAAFVALKLGGLGVKLVAQEITGGFLMAASGIEKLKVGFNLTTAGAGKFINKVGGAGAKIGGLFGKIGNTKAFGGIASFFGTMGGKVGGLLTKLNPFAGIMQKIAGSKVVGGASKLLGVFGKIGGVIGGLLGPIAPIVAVIGGLIVAFQLVTKHIDDIRNVVGKLFGDAGLKVFDSLLGTIKSIGEAIKGVFSEENLDGARNTIQNLFGEKGVAIFNSFIGILKSLGSGFMQIYNTIATYVTPIVEQMFSYLVNEVLPAIMDKFVEWAPGIQNIVSGLCSAISTAIQVISTGIQVAMPIIKAIFENTFLVIGNIVSGIIETFSGVITMLKQLFSGDFKGALDTLLDIFLNIFNLIKDTVLGVFNNIKEGIAGVISKIKGLAGGKVSTATDESGNATVSVKGFAKGTNSTPDTFIAGEEGPELITGAKGRKVFTAPSTKAIFNRLNGVGAQLPSFGGESGAMQLNITNAPNITVQGGADLAEMQRLLDKNNADLIDKVETALEKRKARKQRLTYGTA